MKAHLMFQTMSPDLTGKIFEFFQSKEKEAWRTALAQLAAIRKFRPIFVQKKSREDQARFVRETLKLRGSETIAEQILQVWLMKDRTEMLALFLDKLEIPHDGKGAADDIPGELDPGKLKEAIAALQAAYPKEEVGIYLNLFQRQKDGGWPEIEAALAEG